MKTLILDHISVIEDQPSFPTTSSIAGGATSITFAHINSNYGVNSYLWLDYGKSNGEIVRITDITPSSNTFTITATKYAHAINTIGYNIRYDQVEFAHSDNTSQNPTLLALLAINPSQNETIYSDLAHNDGFGYIRLYNSETEVYEPIYSGPSPYNVGRNTVKFCLDQALQNLNLQDRPNFITPDYAVGLINSLESSHAQQSKRPIEVQEREYNLGTLRQGEWELPLPENIAERYTNKSIESLRVAGGEELTFVFKNEFNQYLENSFYTDLSGTLQTTDTVVNVVDASGLPSSGSVNIGNDKVAYTSRTDTVLSGISGVTTNHSTGDMVTAGMKQGKPTHFTIWNNKIYVYPVMGDEQAGYPFYIDYFSRMGERIQSLYTTTIFEDLNVPIKWLEYHIIKKDNQGQMTQAERDTKNEFDKFWRQYSGMQGKVAKNTLGHYMDRYFKGRR